MARRPVDEKIIKLSMDNRDLASKAAESTTLLSKLRDGLNKIPGVNLGKTTQEIGRLGEGVKGINMESLAAGVDTVSRRFSNLGIVGMSVVQDLTRRVVDAASRMGRAIINPIVEGGRQRALNIEQAKFQFEGLGMDVEASMESANQAVLGTAFGLDEAALAAAMFGASGMRAGDEMTSALRAISGVAAMTGSSYSDIANIFTAVSGNGRVMGNDLLRLSSRGVNAAATLADALGTTEAEVREMVTRGEIDFETFATAMDNAFGEHATKASETYTGALSNLRAALGRLGAAVATPAHEALRKVFVAITPVIDSVSAALGPLIERWAELMDMAAGTAVNFFEGMDLSGMSDGILSLWTSFENILKAVHAILGPVGEALLNLIPESTGSLLMSLITGFEKFTESLIISEASSDSLRNALMSFSNFIKGLADTVIRLASSFADAIPGIVGKVKSLASTVADYLGRIGISFKSFGDFLDSVWDSIMKVIRPVWDFIKEIFSGVEFRHILGGGFLAGLASVVKKIVDNMSGLEGVWKGISEFIESMKSKEDKPSFLTNISDALTGFSDALQEGVSLGRIVAIASAIGILAVAMKVLEDLDTAQVTRGMAAIAGSMVTLSWGMKALDGVNIGGVGGVKVIAFATAVSILTRAMSSISDISTSGLVKGATAIATATAILVTAIRLLDGVKVGTGPITMIAIAGAVKILVGTLEDIDAVRVEGLVKGIGTIGLLLAELAIFANVMDGVKIKMGTVLSIAAIAGVMHILVDAIAKIDDIRVEGLIKGLGTIGILLAEIAIFGTVMQGIKIGPGMALGVLGIAQAMVIMANAIKQLDGISVGGLVKGLVTIGVILAEIAVFAIVAQGTNMISTALGVGLIATAIAIMVPPLKELGEMRWQDLVKGLVGMAGALGAMAIVGTFASGAIGGAIAIGIMALALDEIIDPIERMQSISWGDLLSSLLKLGTALAVVAGASYLLSPAVGPMLGFSAALVGFGAAIALAGAGLALFGTGLTTLAGLTATSVAAIVAAVEMLIDGFIGLLDKIGEAITAVITLIADLITENAGTIVTAVVELLLAVLRGIDEYLPEFIEVGSSIVINLMNGISEKSEELAIAATDMSISLIDALTAAIDENGGRLIDSILRLIGQILILLVDAGIELVLIVAGWIPGVDEKVREMGDGMTSAIRETFGLDEEVDKTIQRGGENIDGSRDEMANKTGLLGSQASDEFDSKYIIDQYGEEKGQKLIAAINAGRHPTQRAGAGLGTAGSDGLKTVSWDGAARDLVSGFSGGIRNRSGTGSSVWSAAWNLGKSALSAIRNAIGSQSPAKETTKEGENFGMGFINGISSLISRVGQTAGTMAREAVDTTNYFLDNLLSDMDREVHVKVVLDTSEIDEWDPREFSPLRPDTSFTNRMVAESQPRSNQNENNIVRNDKNSERFRGDNVTYDIDIHTTDSELNDDTARRWAKKLSVEIEKNNNENRRGNGVIVNHVY